MGNTRRDRTVHGIGETMLMLQRIEQLLLANLLFLGSGTEADQRLEKLLLRDKETLGRLMDHFAKRFDLPATFQASFDDLLERRNLFVHNLLMAPWFDLSTDAGCSALDDYLREMHVSAKVVLKVLLGAAFAPTEPQPSQEASDRAARILSKLERSVVRDFGGLTEDQYIRKAVSEARDGFVVPLKSS